MEWKIWYDEWKKHQRFSDVAHAGYLAEKCLREYAQACEEEGEQPPVTWQQFPSDNLPNKDCFILVWRPGLDSPQVMFFSWVNDSPQNGGGWYLSELDGDQVKDMPLVKDENFFPTHWMPLPELPSI